MDLVLIPDHESAPILKELAEAARPGTGTVVHIVSRLDPGGVDEATLDDCRSILLLDDMVASGATMHWLADRLKVHLGRSRFAQLDLRGFVILDCTPGGDELKAVRSYFTSGKTGRARFSSCESVPLPHPDDECPWCAELKDLEGSMGTVLEEHPQYFADRVRDLRQRPLRNLSPVASAPFEAEGTFIGNISAPTAFVRWASALQARRAEVQIPGEGHPPSYYVDAGFFLQWRDWSQCAGVLRTANESEIRYTGQEPDFERKWRTGSAVLEPAKLAEFGWAAIEGKLTAPSASLVRQTLEERAGEDPAIAAFAAILGARGLLAYEPSGAAS